MFNKDKNKNFSFFKVAGRTAHWFYKSLDAWKITFTYGGILTMFSVLFSRYEYSCHGSQQQSWCYDLPQTFNGQILFYAVFCLLITYFVFSFLGDVYGQVFKNTVFKPLDIIKPNKDKLKRMCFLFGFFVLFVGLFVAAWLIVLKPANPDWRIEFLYFVAAFACAFTPLILLRISAFIGYYLQDLHLPSFDKMFKQTAGHSYVGVVGFMLCLLLACVINLRMMGEFNHLSSEYNMFVVALGLEFIDYVVKLAMLTCFICFFHAEYEVMEEAVVSPKPADSSIKEQPAVTISKKINGDKKAKNSVQPAATKSSRTKKTVKTSGKKKATNATHKTNTSKRSAAGKNKKQA